MNYLEMYKLNEGRKNSSCDMEGGIKKYRLTAKKREIYKKNRLGAF